MDVPPIRLLGDPVLRTPTTLVTDFDEDLVRLVERMNRAMHSAEGVGLAANQIGVGLRVFVYDIGGPDQGHVVNPVLSVDPAGDTYEELEGCLSLPEQHHPCVRWSRAAVHGFDLDDQPLEVHGDGLLARCLQHEVDHLDGGVYIDRISRRERRRALDEYALYQAGTPGRAGDRG